MAGMIGRLARSGVRRGVIESSTVWGLIRLLREDGVAVTAVLAALRVAHLIVAERPVSATFELQAGEAVEVRVVEPPPR
jgi:hypothetical protein